MKSNFDILDYELINDKENKGSLIYKVVMIFSIIGIIIILCKFEFKVYERQTLIKNGNDFILIVDSRQIDSYKTQKHIFINRKKYAYKILKIDSDYSNVNGVIYQSIYINLHNYKTDAITLECYFLKSSKTIYEEIIEFITGGKDGKT